MNRNSSPVRVLFVCLGNICRSTMAEAVMRHKVTQADLEGVIQVDSAGTSSYHVGEPPHRGTRKRLEQAGIPWKGISSRQLNARDIEKFDYIIGMDRENVRDIKSVASSDAHGKIYRLSQFDSSASWKDVPDPWITGDFETTYRLVDEGCGALLEHLQEML